MKKAKRISALLVSLAICLSLIPIPAASAAASGGTETRKEMQDAILETAWAYYFKDQQVQYDSATLTALKDKSYCAYRVTAGQSPEYATSDNTLFAVCSYYLYDVYYNALGYEVGGGGAENARTTTLWTSFPEEAVIARWDEKDPSKLIDPDGTLAKVTDGVGLADWFRENWEDILQPGDWILTIADSGGHTTMYMDHGMMLECYGGKYSAATGKDLYESTGAIRLNGIDNYYTNTSSTTYLGRGIYQQFMILRPLDLLVDEDGVSNGQGKISASARSRQEYPGLEIDRTVDITPYGTAVKGDTLTYSITITNNSSSTYTKGVNATAEGVAVNYVNWYAKYHGQAGYAGTNYTGLTVTETVPEGTTLAGTDGKCTETDGQLSWTVDLKAGESVTLSYTVTVTADYDAVITNNGGKVDNIPSNTIANRVGGKKLSAEALSHVNDFQRYAEQYSELLTQKGVANGIYEGVFGLELDLPDAETLVKALFEKHSTYEMLILKEYDSSSLYRTMLVDKYIGGNLVHTVQADDARIWDFNQNFFEVGDILIKGALGSLNTLTVKSSRYMVYLGNGCFGILDEDGYGAASISTQLYTDVFKSSYDFFFLLRPSQAYEDLNSELTAAQPLTPDPSLGGAGEDVPEEPGTTSDWQQAIAETAYAYWYKTAYASYSRDALTFLGNSGTLAATWNISPEEISAVNPYYGVEGYLIYEVFQNALGVLLAEDQNGMLDISALTSAYKVDDTPAKTADIVVLNGNTLALCVGDGLYLTMSDTADSPIAIGPLSGQDSITAVLRPLDYVGGSAHLTGAGAGRQQYPGLEITLSTSLGSAYATAAQGSEVTYTLTVKNHSSNTYNGLELTQYVARKGTYNDQHEESGAAVFNGYTAASRMLSWTADLAAGGEVSVSYTVTVGAMGDDALVYYLTASGKVGGNGRTVSTATLSNRIGYSKLDEQQQSLLLSLTDDNITTLIPGIKTAIAGIRTTYQVLDPKGSVGTLPSFTWLSDYKDEEGGGILIKVKDQDAENYGLLEQIALEDASDTYGLMVVENFLGGEYLYAEQAQNRRVLDPSLAYLEPGDYILTLLGTKAADGGCSVQLWLYAGYDAESSLYKVINFNNLKVLTYSDPRQFFTELDLLHAYDAGKTGETRHIAFCVARPSQVADIGKEQVVQATEPLQVTVSSDPTPYHNVSTGDTIDYVITVTNNTDAAVTDVQIEAVVENGKVDAGSVTGGTAADSTVRWTIPEIAAGASVSVTFTASVTAGEQEDISVVATASGGVYTGVNGIAHSVTYPYTVTQKAALLNLDRSTKTTTAVSSVRNILTSIWPETAGAANAPSQSSYISAGTRDYPFIDSSAEPDKYEKNPAINDSYAKRMNMLVFYGGANVVADQADPEYITPEEFRFEFLEPGDYISVKSGTTPFFFYLGQNAAGEHLIVDSTGVTAYSSEDAASFLDGTWQWYFAIRPTVFFDMSKEIEDLNGQGSVQLTLVNESGSKLTGAVFELYRDSNANGKWDAADEKIGDLSEGDTGVYGWTGLEYDGYFIKQTKAPEGYVADENAWYFEIIENGATVIVENQTGKGFVNTLPTGTPEPGSLKIEVTAVPAPYTNVRTGDTIDYVVTVTNSGSAAISDVEILAALEKGLLDTGSVTGGTADGNTAKWTLEELAAGTSVRFTFSATVTAGETEDISVVATAAGSGLTAVNGIAHSVTYPYTMSQKAALLNLDKSTKVTAIANVRSILTAIWPKTSDATNTIAQSSYIVTSNDPGTNPFIESQTEPGKYEKNPNVAENVTKRLNMLVFFGGTNVVSDQADPEYVTPEEFRFAFLEPGDYITAKAVSGTPFFFYLGQNAAGEYLFVTSTGVTAYSAKDEATFVDSTWQWYFTVRPTVFNDMSKEIEDQAYQGSVQLTLVSRDDLSSTLTGAEFALYRDSNGNGVLDETDESLGTLTEESAGVYGAEDLTVGGYFVQETKAPEGFLIDENAYYFVILEDGATVIVENETGKGFVNAPEQAAEPGEPEIKADAPSVSAPEDADPSVTQELIEALGGEGTQADLTDIISGDQVYAELSDAAQEALENADDESLQAEVSAYLSIVPKAYEENTSLTLDITPMYRVDLKQGDETVQSDTYVLETGIDADVVISLQLPDGFFGGAQTGYVAHKGYVYTGTVSGDVITFTNPHGFSEFTVYVQNPAVASVNGTDYTTLQAAVDAVENGGEIVLLSDADTSAVLHESKSFTVRKGDALQELPELTITTDLSGYQVSAEANADGSVTYSLKKAATGGSTTGSGSSAAYAVTVRISGAGSVSVDRASTAQGNRVTVTVVPSEGYLLGDLTVIDASGRAIAVTDNGDGTWSFTMPASNVTVTVVFQMGAHDCPSAPFTDVDQDLWYHEGIDYAVSHGLMNGVADGKFDPNGTTTRSQLVTILYRLEGKPVISTISTFTDVPAGQWYTDAVTWAEACGIVNGKGANTFAPDDPITREEFAAIMYRYAQYKGYDVTAQADLSAFADAGTVSAWALISMRWAVAAGLIAGTSADTLAPSGSAIRAQAATILMRFCESVAQ